jgi:CBS domain-containing protein
MARSVSDIMSRELLVVSPDTEAQVIRDLLQSYAVSSVPVVDEGRHPLGIVTACAVLEGTGTARDRMSRPAACVDGSTAIEAAARRLATEDAHNLVVVDGAGSAVGIVSALDVMRAMLGVPAHHPQAFPHWDEGMQWSWTDDWPLDESQALHAPDAPGVLLLVQEEVGKADVVVWVEECANVRERAAALANGTACIDLALAGLLAREGMCFRAAAVPDSDDRERAVMRWRARLESRPPPGAT